MLNRYLAARSRALLLAVCASALAALSLASAASASYSLQMKFGGPAPGSFREPQGIATDRLGEASTSATDANGNVYVVDEGNQRVSKFTASGTFLLSFGSRGGGAGQFYDPYGISVDSHGTVSVVDIDRGDVQRFDSSGQYLSSVDLSQTGLDYYCPQALANDAADHLYVVDGCSDTVYKFDGAGVLVGHFGGRSSYWDPQDGTFSCPYGITAGADGTVYVSDTCLADVQKFSGDGTYLGKFGGQGDYYNRQDGDLVCPRGVAIGSGGKVLVTDSCRRDVQVFSAAGAFVSKFGGSVSDGPADGKFECNDFVATDGSGNAYVSDNCLDNVQKFDASGNFVTKWGHRSGTGPGELRCPSRVASSVV